ncbi:hypothetical protein TUBRATIS_004230 [Tubulinosema ratisbonensis]|uniref:Uncharacterized protein n=1 Tax=Tubulinosema ratisbonensis TaxID=291195 RepID=A0A437APN1_9MICR|nr:hypothetical protein TUBRATIS_004230 [Tubulinosema ratisbonensis]
MEEIKKIIKYINSEKIDKEDYYTLKDFLSNLESKYLTNNLYTIFSHLEKEDNEEIRIMQNNQTVFSIKQSDTHKINLKENEFRSNLISEKEFLNELKNKIKHKVNERSVEITEEISVCEFNDLNTFSGNVIKMNYTNNIIHCLYCYIHFVFSNCIKEDEVFILNGDHTLLGKIVYNFSLLDIDSLLQNFIQQNKFLYLKENFNKFFYSEKNLTKLNEILELRYFLAKENNCSLDLVMTDLQILTLLEKKDILSLDRISSVVRGNFADFSFLFKNEVKECKIEKAETPLVVNNFSKSSNLSEKQEDVNKLTFSNKKIKKRKEKSLSKAETVRKKQKEGNKKKIAKKNEEFNKNSKINKNKDSLTKNKSKLDDVKKESNKTKLNNKSKDSKLNKSKEIKLHEKSFKEILESNKKRKINGKITLPINDQKEKKDLSNKKINEEDEKNIKEIKKKVKKINLKNKK